MPRFYSNNTHQNNQEKIIRSGNCRTRKRVSSSASSTTSSSVVKNYRLNKKAILVGKRVKKSSNYYCSSNTPVVLPAWKVIMAGSRSPMQKMCNFEDGVKFGKDGISNNNNYHNMSNNNCGNKGKEALSARKLGASLWEISPNGGIKDGNFEERRGRKSSEKLHPHSHLMLDQFPHRSPVCEKTVGSKEGSHRRRSSATSQKLQVTEYLAGDMEPLPRPTSIQVSNGLSMKSRLKDVNSSLIASKELVKVLYRIMSQEEQQSSRLTLVSALRVELDRARLQVDQLIQEQRFECNQMVTLFKEFTEEKAAWKSKEKQKIKEAISSLTREIDTERKLRRQAERLNKKLGAELADTRDHFERAMKELDGERRAREILEQTCDELARGIGEERVEVEELKKESAKAREEVEKERQMLQLADVLREERVQMKLEEARYEYEEKNAALERLRTQLGIYSKENRLESSSDLLKTVQLGLSQDGDRENEESGDEEDEVDSSDSELHSIELNMDNSNKCYKWSFANNETDADEQGTDSKRDSVDEVFKGRRSLSEKIQWESICLQRETSNGIEWDFTAANLKTEACENGESNANKEDRKRYNPVNSQRFQGTASPAMSTGSTSRLREACSAILQDLAARRDQLEGHCLGSKR